MLSEIQNVEIVPRQDGIVGLLDGCRAVLFPSLVDETFPLIPIEAMLHGVPVLGSDIGAVPEAMLGCRYVLPARPLERLRVPNESRTKHYWLSPIQEIEPWSAALLDLQSSLDVYTTMSRNAARAAQAYAEELSWEPVFDALMMLAATAKQRTSDA